MRQEGASARRRGRSVTEVARAVVADIGAERVGIRISPTHNPGRMGDRRCRDTRHLRGARVGPCPPGRGVLEHAARRPRERPHPGHPAHLRRRLHRELRLLEPDDARDEAASVVEDDIADLVAVGRPTIANPDLVTRWEQGASENEVDHASVYGGGERGYTDYPSLQN